MCPKAWEFWRDVRPVRSTTYVAVAPFDRFTIIPDPERVAMVISTGGTVVSMRPLQPAIGMNTVVWNPNVNRPYLTLRIDEYGQLMFAPWELFITSAGGNVNITELCTGKNQK